MSDVITELSRHLRRPRLPPMHTLRGKGTQKALSRTFKPQQLKHQDRIFDTQQILPLTEDDLIRLAITFTRQDLSSLTKKEVLFIDSILKGFTLFRLEGSAQKSNTVRQRSYSVVPMSKEEVLDIQKTMRDCFTSILSEKGEWTLPGLPQGAFIARTSAGRGKYSIHRHFMAEFPYTLWFAIAEWLEALGDRFKGCPECKYPFVAVRRQAYCSDKCSQRVRTRKWYSEHRQEVSEKRHQVYIEQVRKKHPKAKVQRRVRSTTK